MELHIYLFYFLNDAATLPRNVRYAVLYVIDYERNVDVKSIYVGTCSSYYTRMYDHLSLSGFLTF